MTEVTWSGLERHGMWRGHNIVIRKMTRKITSPARVEEMLDTTVKIVALKCPLLMPVSAAH